MIQVRKRRQRCAWFAILVGGLLSMSSHLACSPQEHARNHTTGTHALPSSSDSHATTADATGTASAFEVPDNWKPGRQTAMRKASFVAQEGDKEVKITVIPLDENALSLLDCVNGWCKQLGIEPITQDDLEKTTTLVPVGSDKAHFVELLSAEDSEQRKCILGAVAIRDGKAWFIRLFGDADLAQREKEHFLDFLKSLNLDVLNNLSAPSHNTAGDNGSATKRPSATFVCGKTSENWKPAELRGIRKAAFLVQDGKQKALITVMELLPHEGDLLANVNIWRAQIALAPISQEALDEATSNIKVAGIGAPYVQLVGPETAQRRAAVFAVVVPFNERCWFFTIKGDADLVLREKERFEAFVTSSQLTVEPEVNK